MKTKTKTKTARKKLPLEDTRADRTDWDAQPLGRVPDAQIAEEQNCTREAVRRQRAKRGIPKFVKPKVPRVPKVKVESHWKSDELLGKVPDQQVARIRGVALSTVTRARLKLRIPAFGRKKRAAVENV